MQTVKGKKIAWQWIQKHKLNKLSDMVNPMGQERVVLQQRKTVDEGYNRIHSETAQQRRKLGSWYDRIVDRRYMEGATVTRYSIPKDRVQHAISYQRSHKTNAEGHTGGSICGHVESRRYH